jgi:hypothetical protein
MDKKAMVREYKETPRPMGIYQIMNKANGKVLIRSSVNVPAILSRLKFELQMGNCREVVLQKEWKQFGPEMFEFAVLELLKPVDDPTSDRAEDLQALEALWIERLAPFGDKGYNKVAKVGT